MQRHALVFYYKLDVLPRSPPIKRQGLISWVCRRLTPRPPKVNGIAVVPISSDGQNVPTLGYLRNFWALRAHTSPRQVNVELTILLAEMVVLWGGMWLLAT